jgi:carboxymethylenebutenolidase
MMRLRVSSPFLCIFSFFVASVWLAGGQAARAQDWAKAKLAQSPRHREYVSVPANGRSVNTFVVFPEVRDKAPVVVLIHEIFGLSDWFKLQADELAARGFIVLAPDLLSGWGPAPAGTPSAPPAPSGDAHAMPMGGQGAPAVPMHPGGTSAFPDQDAVVRAVVGLNPDEVISDLIAVSDYGKSLPSANGKLAVAGFCWGGGKSFDFATHRRDLSKAFVFYGPPPKKEAMARITAPVYGFYAGNDARISATVPQTTTDMKAAGKAYEPVIYDGAGHGFMRAGQAPDATPANQKAFEEGFARLVKELDTLK